MPHEADKLGSLGRSLWALSVKDPTLSCEKARSPSLRVYGFEFRVLFQCTLVLSYEQGFPEGIPLEALIRHSRKRASELAGLLIESSCGSGALGKYIIYKRDCTRLNNGFKPSPVLTDLLRPPNNVP